MKLYYARSLGKTVSLLALVAILNGCTFGGGVKPEPPIVTKQEYIIKVPPADLLKIPPKVKDLDVDTAKQSDVARWINETVDRMDKMENQIIGIGKFFNDEQKKLEPKRITK